MLRPMVHADVELATTIESKAAQFPWPRAQFFSSFNNGHDCLVYEVDKAVVGFAIYSSVLNEVSLMNIAVDPASQSCGIGRRLLKESLQRQKEQGMDVCFLEVRVSNDRAITLYESLGFNKVGLRKAYYPGRNTREDAILMKCDL